MSQVNFKTKAQIGQITVECCNAADQDRNAAITINEFYNLLILVYQKLGLYRNVTQQDC